MGNIQSFLQRKEKELGVVLNKVQQQAVSTTEGPLLLLASPGSGKTTTLIMRIGYLMEEKGVSPNKIKAVTFSRAAAQDMENRFKKFFPSLPSVHFSTIHSFAFQVVREYFQKKERPFTLIEGEGPIHKKVCLRQLFMSINQENIQEDQLDELITYISYIKNKLIEEKKWDTVPCDVPNAALILKKYEEFKRNYPVLLVDYDDLLTLANEILEKDNDYLKKYQQMYDYILTDESQDTSLVQHLIIEKLVRQHQNLCVVADDDQSIYSWRGAEPHYLLQFKQVYPQAKILKMEQNYRSSKNIVHVANQFIKQNKDRYMKNMFTDNKEGSAIIRTVLTDDQEQGDYLVKKLKEETNLSDVAILYRNHLSSIPLLNKLDLAGIPVYLKEGDKRFFKHWVVEDIKNFMRMAFNDRLPHIFEKIYNKFNGYVSKQQMDYLKKNHNGQSVFDQLMSIPGIKDYQIKKLQTCKSLFQKMKTESPKKVIQMIREDLGYNKALEGMAKRLGFNKDPLFTLLHMLEEIAHSETTMEGFVHRLQYLEQLAKNTKRDRQSAVTLLTLHSAKGLEFEKVYMVDLVEGIIPNNSEIESFKKGDRELMEEAVRLFYVGMTRAKNDLELITYKEQYGQKTKVSRFFNDVDRIINGNKQRKKEMDYSTYSIENKVISVNELQVGKIVKHRVFGKGKIIKMEKDRMEVQFTREVKKMDIHICIGHGLLEVIKG